MKINNQDPAQQCAGPNSWSRWSVLYDSEPLDLELGQFRMILNYKPGRVGPELTSLKKNLTVDKRASELYYGNL